MTGFRSKRIKKIDRIKFHVIYDISTSWPHVMGQCSPSLSPVEAGTNNLTGLVCRRNHHNNKLCFVMVMNLYSAFSINIFKCALQARDLWVRSDISIYRRRYQSISDLTQQMKLGLTTTPGAPYPTLYE